MDPKVGPVIRVSLGSPACPVCLQLMVFPVKRDEKVRMVVRERKGGEASEVDLVSPDWMAWRDYPDSMDIRD